MTNSSETQVHQGDVGLYLKPLISNDLSLILDTINFSLICQSIVLFGMVTNIINMVVFVRQGMDTAVNITLFGLAVSDFSSLALLIWMNVSYSAFMKLADLDFIPTEVQYITSGRPHSIMSRVTEVITAFLTLQRCVCVTMPLKAKTIFSVGRTKLIIVSIFVVVITLACGPLYYNNRLAWKFDKKRNKSRLGLVFAPDREAVEAVSLPINNAFIHFGAFFTILVCTIILVVKLKAKNKWRNKSVSISQSDNLSERDLKVSKLVILLSVMFMICFTPMSFIVTPIMVFVREFSVEGVYTNIHHVSVAIGFIFEAINSSMNIFIYYRMSSKYRADLRALFGMKE